MPLVHDLLAVGALDERAGVQLGGICAEAHRAAEIDHLTLLVHEVDDGMGRVRVELARVGAGQAADVARELDDRAVEAETQAEERQAVFPGEAGGSDLAFDAPEPEAARDHDPVEVLESPFGEQALGVVRGDPVDQHPSRARVAAVAERLGDGQVGVGKVHVLADQADAHLLVGSADAVHEVAPLAEDRRLALEMQHLAHVVVEALVVEHQRDLVEALGVDGRDDARLGHVAELRDLLLEPRRDGPVRAAHDGIGLDAAAA